MNESKAREFLDAILAQPDDDAPRLIFADWLEEEGEHDRAEFIRVQIERARLPEWDARQVRLCLREAALLEKHGRHWRRELPDLPGIRWSEFRRGFVATVFVESFAALTANADVSWAKSPIEAVSIPWPREGESVGRMAPIAGLRELTITEQLMDHRELSQLAEAPLLSTVRVVNMGDCFLGVEGFRRLILSPYLGNLTALRLPGTSIGNEGMSALFSSQSLPSLTELDLSEAGYGRYGEDPVIEGSGMETLAAWPGLRQIRSLNLSGHAPSRSGLRALLRSPQVGELKELVLRDTGLESDAMEEFGAACPALKLDVLSLSHNLVRDLGVAHLRQAPCLRELKVLLLDRCELSRAGAREVAGAPFLRTLRRIGLSSNRIGPRWLRVLLDNASPELHTLIVGDTNLGDKGVAYLTESPASDKLLYLDLCMNALKDPSATALAESKYLHNLLSLRLDFNIFSLAAVDDFKATPFAKRLARLELSHRMVDGTPDEIPF